MFIYDDLSSNYMLGNVWFRRFHCIQAVCIFEMSFLKFFKLIFVFWILGVFWRDDLCVLGRWGRKNAPMKLPLIMSETDKIYFSVMSYMSCVMFIMDFQFSP